MVHCKSNHLFLLISFTVTFALSWCSSHGWTEVVSLGLHYDVLHRH